MVGNLVEFPGTISNTHGQLAALQEDVSYVMNEEDHYTNEMKSTTEETRAKVMH